MTCLQLKQHINLITFCPNRTERQSWICYELLLNPINKYIPHCMLQACGVNVELRAFFFFFLFWWRINCEREDWYCLPHPVKSDVTDAKWCITELCNTLRTIRRSNNCVATWIWWKYYCLVDKSCSTPCDPMDCSTPGFPVLHDLLEFAQIHVHWVSDATDHLTLCHLLLLLPSIFPSIRVFSYESALCIRWPKDWSFSFSISPSNECSGLMKVGRTKSELKPEVSMEP